MIETKTKKDSAFITYLRKIFSKKQVITKLIILAAAAIVVLVPASIFYGLWSNTSHTWAGAIIGIRIVWNPGIATSALAGQYGGIYAIQSLVFIVLLLVYWFLTQDKVSCSFVALAVFGGLFNLIQRAAQQGGSTVNCVFDYLYFTANWLKWMSLGDTTFNWPDMGVVIGIVGFVISYIIHIILQVVRDKKKSKEFEQNAIKYEEASKSIDTTQDSQVRQN